jgi:hypothetical protein
MMQGMEAPLNPTQFAIALGSLLVTIFTSVIVATWILRGYINSVKTELSKENADLKLELSSIRGQLEVQKVTEDHRTEKVNQMYAWWMKFIENGWVAQMKQQKANGA